MRRPCSGSALYLGGGLTKVFKRRTPGVSDLHVEPIDPSLRCLIYGETTGPGMLLRPVNGCEKTIGNYDRELVKKKSCWLDVKAFAQVEARQKIPGIRSTPHLRKMGMVDALSRWASRQSSLSLMSRDGSNGSGPGL
jgi:hypothetical protein